MDLWHICAAIGVTPSSISRKVKVSRTTVYKACGNINNVSNPIRIKILTFLLEKNPNPAHRKILYSALLNDIGVKNKNKDNKSYEHCIEEVLADLIKIDSMNVLIHETSNIDKVESMFELIEDRLRNVRKKTFEHLKARHME